VQQSREVLTTTVLNDRTNIQAAGNPDTEKADDFCYLGNRSYIIQRQLLKGRQRSHEEQQYLEK